MFFGILFRYPRKWGHTGGLFLGCLGGGVSGFFTSLVLGVSSGRASGISGISVNLAEVLGFEVSLVNLGFSGSFFCNSFLGYLSTPDSVGGSNLMRTIRPSAKTATIIAIKPASRGNNVDAS